MNQGKTISDKIDGVIKYIDASIKTSWSVEIKIVISVVFLVYFFDHPDHKDCAANIICLSAVLSNAVALLASTDAVVVHDATKVLLRLLSNASVR